MNKEFKQIVFNTNLYHGAEAFECAKEFLIKEQGIMEPTDELVYEELNTAAEINLDTEKEEFARMDREMNGTVVAIANVGRWNGRKNGFKKVESMPAIFEFLGKYDEFELFIDRYNLKAIGHHHDGTDYVTFRLVPDKFDFEDFDCRMFTAADDEQWNRVAKRYTRSLRPYFKGYLY